MPPAALIAFHDKGDNLFGQRARAVISEVGGGALNPDAGDLALTAGWGHAGKGGATMPGKGKVITRDYTPEELTAIREGTGVLGLTLEQALEHLGKTTCDIYLNEVAYWRNIPTKVWGYYIGGSQVIKKWLSYRERDLLGRPLTLEEAREVTHMACRLAAIVLIEPALNVNYQAVNQSTYYPSSTVNADFLAQVVDIIRPQFRFGENAVPK